MEISSSNSIQQCQCQQFLEPQGRGIFFLVLWETNKPISSLSMWLTECLHLISSNHPPKVPEYEIVLFTSGTGVHRSRCSRLWSDVPSGCRKEGLYASLMFAHIKSRVLSFLVCHVDMVSNRLSLMLHADASCIYRHPWTRTQSVIRALASVILIHFCVCLIGQSIKMFIRGRPITMYIPSNIQNYEELKMELPSQRLELDWVYPCIMSLDSDYSLHRDILSDQHFTELKLVHCFCAGRK